MHLLNDEHDAVFWCFAHLARKGVGSGWVTRTRSGELWTELHNGGKESAVGVACSTQAMRKRPNPCSLWFFKQEENVHPWTGY